MITQRYNLNLIPDKVPVIVNCSQYDAFSRTIEMVIFDGSTIYTIPSGTSASVRGTKQDNTGFEYPCTIDGSVVSFDIQDQMTIFSGRVPCEIRLSKDGGIIGTCNFLLNVEETPLDPDVTISETVLPLLEEAEQNAVRAEQAAEEAVSVLSSAVKSVNDVHPDSDGNVEIQVSSPLTAGTGIEITNDVVTNTAPVWHGDEVGSLPVPINADQLEGHPASYFQQALTTRTYSFSWLTTPRTGNVETTRWGRMVICAGYFIYDSAIANGTQLAKVDGVSLISSSFTTIGGSADGLGRRLALDGNGNITAESDISSGNWYSFTFIALSN